MSLTGGPSRNSVFEGCSGMYDGPGADHVLFDHEPLEPAPVGLVIYWEVLRSLSSTGIGRGFPPSACPEPGARSWRCGLISCIYGLGASAYPSLDCNGTGPFVFEGFCHVLLE